EVPDGVLGQRSPRLEVISLRTDSTALPVELRHDIHFGRGAHLLHLGEVGQRCRVEVVVSSEIHHHRPLLAGLRHVPSPSRIRDVFRTASHRTHTPPSNNQDSPARWPKNLLAAGLREVSAARIEIFSWASRGGGGGVLPIEFSWSSRAFSKPASEASSRSWLSWLPLPSSLPWPSSGPWPSWVHWPSWVARPSWPKSQAPRSTALAPERAGPPTAEP